MLLKDIRKRALKEDNDIFSYPFRYISTIITSILIKTNITPTQVTVIHLFLGIISALLFLMGRYQYTVLASFLLISSFILDCVDGEIARYKNIKSKFGAWLDH
ncbi:MAG: CDP-alcohol phosphatidyltransferase family protein, partial [Nanoarchaeota archaeon]